MAEYTLNYTGAEINAKLGMIDQINDSIKAMSGSDGFELIGQSPLQLEEKSTIRLSCSEQCSYNIKTDTVLDIDEATFGDFVNCKLVMQDGFTELQSTGGNAWYNCYVDATMTGLTVGENYTIYIDCLGLTLDTAVNRYCGHYILYDASGTSLANFGNSYTGGTTNINAIKATFTATTETVRLRMYPANNSVFKSGISVSNFNGIYINRANTSSNHTAIYESSGIFTTSKVITNVPKYARISTTPICDVYTYSSSEETDISKSRHGNKICVCFGDSVTGNMSAPNDYPSIIAEETGMTVVNAGFGGCRMTNTHPTQAYAAFSMTELAAAVASGSWTLQDTHVNDVSSVTHASEHLEALKAVDWSKVDFITIAYGTNDIQGGVSIDNTSAPMNCSTLCGATRYAIETILGAYPHIKIMLLTPIYRYWNDEDIDSDSKTFSGNSFTDYVDALLDVAKEYKIPVVDMYRTLGFNKINRNYYFPSTDGTHPNAAGLKVMGSKIAGKLLSEY